MIIFVEELTINLDGDILVSSYINIITYQSLIMSTDAFSHDILCSIIL